MSPEEIAARLAALRDAGAELARRPAAATLDSLATVLDGWRDPGSDWRRTLERELPEATGFDPETVREGLAAALSGWSGDALRAQVREELGSEDALASTRGLPSTAVLLAGSIPMPTLVSLVAPLVLRSPVLAKTASRDPVTAPLVARSIAEVDSELGRCVDVVAFPGDDAACAAVLCRADCVVATGSDETVASVAGLVDAPRRLVAYGHRLSIAVVGPEASRGEALRDAATGLARDVALWDQLGCLSPIAVWVAADPAAVDRVADALAGALDDAGKRWPRGLVETAAAAAIARERDEAEIRAAAGQAVTIREGSDWTVVREESPVPRAAPLHRFVRVHPAGDASGVLDAVRPLGPHLAGVALAGFGPVERDLARALAELGASRVCRPGALQTPPLGWRHDDRGLLRPLTR